MKSDVVVIRNTGEGVETALLEASASAQYRDLGKKETIRLQLLAEEMLGMMRQITGDTKAEFWIESTGLAFELHLAAHPLVTGKMRRDLLAASTSGRNAAAKGFMGKVRDLIDRALSDDPDQMEFYRQGIILPADTHMGDPRMYAMTASMVSWSLQHYRSSVEEASASSAAAKAEWDELEKSIVANIADEVRIAISGNEVEMIVYKDFAK